MSTISGPVALPAFLSALDSARSGIDSGLQTAVTAAQAFAHMNVEHSGAPSDAAVGQLIARQQVAAAAKALATSDRMLGSLLDIRA